METVQQSRSGAPARGFALGIVSMFLVLGLLASACDMGGSTAPPASNGQQPPASGAQAAPPTAAQFQPPTNAAPQPPAEANGQNGGTGGNGSANGGGNTPAPAGGGNASNTGAGNSGQAAINFGKMAAEIPINGTDPSQQPIVQMVQRVGPAVVTVVNTLNPQVNGGQAAEARGSGAIIDQQGHIITNNHVVKDEQQLVVIFANGQKQQVRLVGTDPDHDLAVLQATGQMPGVMPLGNSDNLMPGEVVVAIGSALGEFLNTVTVGVVSGLHRSLPEGNGVTIQNLIQTDAAINHGNSGGPLLDLNGELIGINTLGVTQAGQGEIAQGLGFAIPASSVKSVVAQILRQPSGAVTSARPYVGVTIAPVDPQLASYYNLVGPDGQLLSQGALVEKVSPNSPAQQAGVQPGDVIVAVNNQQVTTNLPLGDILTNLHAGDKVTLGVVRGGKLGTVALTLGQHPPGP